jgi:sugar lactone lactonase YvrE
MLDELGAAPVTAPSGLVLHAVLDSLTNVKPIGVTPLTEMAYSLATSASGGLTATNINAAATAVDTAFLNGTPSLNTQPIDVTKYKSAPVAQQQLSKLLVALTVAANQGTATDSGGAACNGASYGERLVCMVSGLGKLIKLDASNKGTLQSNANYIAAAYAQIDSGSVTVAGGQAPSALGLDTATVAQTSLGQALATQAALPGYDPGAAPLPNTKAFFADLRQNIFNQDTTQSFGLAPVLAEMSADIASNVHPALTNTGGVLTALKTASDLLVQSHGNPATGSPVDIITPTAVALASNGDLYTGLLLQKQIVRISAGAFSPFAGTAWVQGSADGTGTAATFFVPRGIAFDPAGNLYVTDAQAHVVRKITPAGAVTTFAGQASAPGYADGTGAVAKFNTPFGVATDSAGNVYVADLLNSVIRKITPAGVVTTFAGLAGSGGEVDGVGAAARFAAPAGIAVDGGGNVYVSDLAGQTIRKILPNGTVSTLAGLANTVGIVDGTGTAARFTQPNSLAVDAGGNLFVASNNGTIRKVTSTGVVTTIAGQAGAVGFEDGTGNAARFATPSSVAVDGSGNVYVADLGNHAIRKIDGTGNVTTFARSTSALKAKNGVLCEYSPFLHSTDDNVAMCRYGHMDSAMLLTMTETGSGIYAVKTQPLTGTANPTPPLGQSPLLSGYTLSTTSAALDASFTITAGAGGALTGAFDGPFYVTSDGGYVTASLSLATSSDWDPEAGTGTLTPAGALTHGGGVGLTSATIGADSKLIIKDISSDWLDAGVLNVAAPPSLQGVLNLSDVTTDKFVYAMKMTIGAPVADKSGKLLAPKDTDFDVSISRLSGGGRTSLFTGNVSLGLQGIDSFDMTQPVSSTNFVTATAQLAGHLTLVGGRELSVSASLNNTQLTPTPDQPTSLTATYSYVTPKGTAQINVTGKYDSTNGYSAMITNNGGVKATLARAAAGGTISGTVTDNGTQTATISGTMISYWDSTVESLF